MRGTIEALISDASRINNLHNEIQKEKEHQERAADNILLESRAHYEESLKNSIQKEAYNLGQIISTLSHMQYAIALLTNQAETRTAELEAILSEAAGGRLLNVRN
ncbi:MAG: hypothetical protein IJJ44_00035 [Solobacterium sp.]|nr:hypothetical protein [Solobacterium sp.]